MADYEFNLETNTACVGSKGTYMGVLYHQLGDTVVPTPIVLPSSKVAKAKEPGAMISLAQTAAKNKLGREVPDDVLAALSVARICMKGAHMVGKRTPADTGRIERVVSYAIARSDRSVELPTEATKKLKRNLYGPGIGRIKREELGMTPVDPLIHLPFAFPGDSQVYKIARVVEALAPGPSVFKPPYIALQTLGGVELERIVLPGEL